MKTIPSQYIDFVTSEEERTVEDWANFRKQVRINLDNNQRVVLSIFNFIYTDWKSPYNDMTDQYDDVKSEINKLSTDELAYLDKLLHKYNLNRDYL